MSTQEHAAGTCDVCGQPTSVGRCAACTLAVEINERVESKRGEHAQARADSTLLCVCGHARWQHYNDVETGEARRCLSGTMPQGVCKCPKFHALTTQPERPSTSDSTQLCRCEHERWQHKPNDQTGTRDDECMAGNDGKPCECRQYVPFTQAARVDSEIAQACPIGIDKCPGASCSNRQLCEQKATERAPQPCPLDHECPTPLNAPCPVRRDCELTRTVRNERVAAVLDALTSPQVQQRIDESIERAAKESHERSKKIADELPSGVCECGHERREHCKGKTMYGTACIVHTCPCVRFERVGMRDPHSLARSNTPITTHCSRCQHYVGEHVSRHDRRSAGACIRESCDCPSFVDERRECVYCHHSRAQHRTRCHYERCGCTAFRVVVLTEQWRDELLAVLSSVERLLGHELSCDRDHATARRAVLAQVTRQRELLEDSR